MVTPVAAKVPSLHAVEITLVGDIGPLGVCFGAALVLLARLAGREVRLVFALVIGDLASFGAGMSWFVASLVGSKVTPSLTGASFATVLNVASGFATFLLAMASIPALVAALKPDSSEWEKLYLGTTVALGFSGLAIIVPLLVGRLVYH